jgi:DNA-directed RNA polymerase sigma subunit (sigma70/sigma32)
MRGGPSAESGVVDAYRRPGGKSWRFGVGALSDSRKHQRGPLRSNEQRLAASDAEKRLLWARLLEANAGTIVETAWGLRGKGVPFSDLVQEGALALFTAVDRAELPDAMELDAYAALVVQQRLT